MTLLNRFLLRTAPLLMLGLALWRRVIGRESRFDLAERLGGSGQTGTGQIRTGHTRGMQGEVWVHGASNGELSSARWVIEALAAQGPVLVTSSTLTGREMVRAWGLSGVRVSLAPLDLGFALRRFGRPRAFVNLEGEFWPARFAAMQGLPIALIGARMSDRSARFWTGIGAGFWDAVTMASAQDQGSEARLRALGVRPWVAPCDLKAEALARMPAPLSRPRAERARVLLAASTHDGEEDAVLKAFAGSDFDLLILAPRHPKRGDAVARLITAQGLGFARRSSGAPMPARGVYLADTMGEMDLWYAAAGVCFVGGSLVDKGGHTPWEPLRHGAAILHGPHVANFAAAYAALDACGGARPRLDLTGLDGAAQDRMAQAARSLRMSGAGEALIAALGTLIDGK